MFFQVEFNNGRKVNKGGRRRLTSAFMLNGRIVVVLVIKNRVKEDIIKRRSQKKK
jgi:hypothetical protein